MPPSPTTPSTLRLSFGDDLFLRRHRGVASPIVNQFVWLFDEPVDPARVVLLRDALTRGALARRADRVRLPGARDRWSSSSHAPDVVVQPAPLSPTETLSWTRAQGQAVLDPARGRGWQLAHADLVGGGAIVSLVVSHAVADGAAMVDAVERTADSRPAPSVPDRPSPGRALLGDLRDSAGQLAEVGRWAASRLVRRPGAAPPPAPTGAKAPEPARRTAPPGPWTMPLVVAELDTASVAAAIAAHDGGPTSWFVTAMAAISRASGRTPPTCSVPVALPVSTRTADDLRSNSTRIARVDVTPDEAVGRDLAAVRARCKAAYAELAEADPASAPIPLALIQMLPDAVIKHLPQPPAAAVLASHMGELSEAFCSAVGQTPRSVAAIAHHVDAHADAIRAMGGGLTAWACARGPVTTLSIAALDPDRVPDDATLERLVHDEFARWNVTATLW